MSEGKSLEQVFKDIHDSAVKTIADNVEVVYGLQPGGVQILVHLQGVAPEKACYATASIKWEDLLKAEAGALAQAVGVLAGDVVKGIGKARHADWVESLKPATLPAWDNLSESCQTLWIPRHFDDECRETAIKSSAREAMQ